MPKKILKFSSDYLHYELVGTGRAKRLKINFVFREMRLDFFKDLLNMFPTVTYQNYHHSISPYFVADVLYLGNTYVFYLDDRDYKAFLAWTLENGVSLQEVDLERKMKESEVQGE